MKSVKTFIISPQSANVKGSWLKRTCNVNANEPLVSIIYGADERGKPEFSIDYCAVDANLITQLRTFENRKMQSHLVTKGKV